MKVFILLKYTEASLPDCSALIIQIINIYWSRHKNPPSGALTFSSSSWRVCWSGPLGFRRLLPPQSEWSSCSCHREETTAWKATGSCWRLWSSCRRCRSHGSGLPRRWFHTCLKKSGATFCLQTAQRRNVQPAQRPEWKKREATVRFRDVRGRATASRRSFHSNSSYIRTDGRTSAKTAGKQTLHQQPAWQQRHWTFESVWKSHFCNCCRFSSTRSCSERD